MERCVTSAIIDAELAVIYRSLYRLSKSEEHQRKHDQITTLINVLIEEREYLRKNYKIEAIEL
jgi:hypothetical protein